MNGIVKKTGALLLIHQLSWGSVSIAEENNGAPQSDKEEVKDIKGTDKRLTVPMGLSRTLQFPFEVGPIYLTDENLINFRRVYEGNDNRAFKLLIIPKNSGYTDMTIHDVNGVPKITYLVHVTREDTGRVISQLEELLKDVEGLRISALEGTVILDGEILLPRDIIRIIRVVDAIRDRDPKKKEVPIRNLATMSKLTLNILAERIEREIGSPEITVRVINNNLFIEGTAEGDFEADRAIEIAKTYLPEVVVQKSKGGDSPEVRYKTAGGEGGLPTIIDLLRVRRGQAPPPAQDIKITMNYVELNNDYERTFNFSWKPLVADQGSVKYDSTVGEISTTLIATVTSLLPKLVTAKQHGHARVLKTEQIIVKDRSEAPAVIDSSIDIYTRLVNEKGEASLQAIPIQNSTKVKAATIQGSDSIDLGIQITLNSLLGTGSSPQVAKNQLQTQVTIKNGDSAALGGFAVDNAVSAYNKEPTGSGAAPGANQPPSSPIFNLSRSKVYNRNKQQYVIFVTPEILRTASAGTEDITRKFRLNAGER